ncbi:hypothetical protein J6590_040394 [Homalodisca vitripennis]|nr:hypothetical protein J6590_040394 [Homalodisca vitripennis]
MQSFPILIINLRDEREHSPVNKRYVSRQAPTRFLTSSAAASDFYRNSLNFDGSLDSFQVDKSVKAAIFRALDSVQLSDLICIVEYFYD